MSVTTIGPFDSRNAQLFARCSDASLWWVRCATCGEGIRVICGDRQAERPHGRLTPFDIHCCICGTRHDHTSCHSCGRCLPRWLPPGCRWLHDEEVPRSDKFYCSNACRQRSYRKRKASA